MPVVAATVATGAAVPASRAVVWTVGALLTAGAFAAGLRQQRRLPSALDGTARRHPVRAALFGVLALLALVQLGRVSVFIANPAQTWGSAVPTPSMTGHVCMGAYVQAADLARRGDPNVYDEAHWPAFHPDADVPPGTTRVDGLAPYLSDPYEYPPTFLLLPRFGLALTNHFSVLWADWFALQAVALLAVACALAGWIGGREGLAVGLLVPVLVASFPTLVNLQFGQAQLLTYTLSLGAFVAFARGRSPLGGALLGAATVFKLFPAVLVVSLAVRRRWRDLGWTLGAVAALTGLALVVVGPASFVAFVRYQLPRLASGEAFSFARGVEPLVARNAGVPGIALKLAALGVPGMGARAAAIVTWAYSLLLVVLVVRTARAQPGDRLGQASVWLALLAFASLRTPFGPAEYVAVGAAWALTLVAARARSAGAVALVVVAWLLVEGYPPLPSPAVDMAVGLLEQVAIIAVLAVALRAPKGASP
jgi:hypothetical protein